MADEGIDAVSDRSTIYQVKWSSKLLQDPGTWLADVIEGERAKIINLIEKQRVSRYILLTSVAGTTTANGTGSIQKLQEKLDEYTEEFRIPVECWWQSDIDAEVDAGTRIHSNGLTRDARRLEAIRYLIHGSQAEGQAARMRDTVLHVMASQWREDAKIKFSQVDMDRVTSLTCSLTYTHRSRKHRRNALSDPPVFVHSEAWSARKTAGAVTLMLRLTLICTCHPLSSSRHPGPRKVHAQPVPVTGPSCRHPARRPCWATAGHLRRRGGPETPVADRPRGLRLVALRAGPVRGR